MAGSAQSGVTWHNDMEILKQRNRTAPEMAASTQSMFNFAVGLKQ